MKINAVINNRVVWFNCDNCKECQDQKDPECTYPVTDCTRHELETLDIRECCNHEPCICERIDAERKYPTERWGGIYG